MQERDITNGSVPDAVNIGLKRAMAERTVGVSVHIVSECKEADSTIGVAAVVKDKRVRSSGRVLCASCVEQERCRAQCGIKIRVVEGQRSTANTGIETARGIDIERVPTKSCISSAAGKKIKRIAAFRCREPGIAPVRVPGYLWG